MNLLKDAQEHSDNLGSDNTTVNVPEIKENPKQQNLNELAVGPVLKTMLKIAIPSMVGMLAVALYNTFDSIFVGQVSGDEALTGLSNFLPTEFMFFSQPIVSASVGASSIISGFMGKKDLKSAAMAQAQFFYVCIIHSLCIPLIFAPWLPKYLSILGVTTQVLPYALQYGYMMTFCGPFVYSMSAGIASLLKCQNKATLAMARQIIGAALNLGLDALFMIPLKMQIKGAALATIISYALTGVWIVIYLFTKKATLKMTRESFKINPKTIWQIYVIGSSTYANFIPGSLSSLLSSVLLRAFSQNLDEARRLQMISGIANRVLGLVQMPQNGLISGIQPLLGYAIGAKNTERIKQVLKTGYLVVLITGAITLASVELGAYYIVKLFSKTPDVWEEAAKMLRITCSGVFFGLLLQLATLVLQQEKRAGLATSLNLCRAFVSLTFQIVLPWTLADPRYMFLSNFAGDVFGGIIGVVLLITFVKRYSK
ncbi:MATE_efflux family protein [Hexamita inflata]|uniref:MATE efflux family protein n=1 Tax=Hexamita inflata TaxID=28002 RepID=A0AA86N5R0_9EUKA|nr:MATE efflux family protein [Hexamita inflata]CAI9915627.1 MATE efflux family protein [Hexamita inflata]